MKSGQNLKCIYFKVSYVRKHRRKKGGVIHILSTDATRYFDMKQEKVTTYYKTSSLCGVR